MYQLRTIAVLAGAAFAATLAGCASTRTIGTQVDDEMLTREVESRMTVDPVASAYDVDVKVFDGNVVLLGEVEDQASKERAESIASQVVGVHDVDNELIVLGVPRESPFDADPDVLTTARINVRYAVDRGVRGRDIDVETIDGVVYLTGIVQSEGEKRLAEIIASDNPGVDDVRNLLRVEPGRH